VRLSPMALGRLCLTGTAALAVLSCGGNSKQPGPRTDSTVSPGVNPAGGEPDASSGEASSGGTGDSTGGSPGEDSCAQCTVTTLGQGGEGFDLDADPHDGVGLDADGSLVLDRDQGDAPQFIWISNTGDDPATVSKIDTRAVREVARYAVGANDPSRTSVSITGDAYVGSRGGRGITKISALGAECPDQNGDGLVTTSTGPDDVLPFGQDECVLWFTALDDDIRGVAAQDLPEQTTVQAAPDVEPVITTKPAEHYVWAGGGTTKRLYKLDGETGKILIDTETPRGVYGLALDGAGILWITGGAYWEGSLAFVDTKRCVSNATCDTSVCTATCSQSDCPGTCDKAVKASIDLVPKDAYGITVDCKQRVWLGGHGGGIKRYDPAAPVDQRLKIAPPATNGVHGITADGDGWIWGANPGTGVIRLEAESMVQSVLVDAHEPKGIAVDPDGKVWAITQGDSAHVITPGALLTDNVLEEGAVTGLASPYSYSDMTGEQLRLATHEPGTYRHLFQGCLHGDTDWKVLRYESNTPKGTSVVFRARSAHRVADLEGAPWFSLAAAPYQASPASLSDAARRAGLTLDKYLEVEVELTADGTVNRNRCAGGGAHSPKVMGFGLSFACAPVVQ